VSQLKAWMIPPNWTTPSMTPVTSRKTSSTKVLSPVKGKKRPEKSKNLDLLPIPSFHCITCPKRWKA
jgi:hypothetical protein